MDATTVILSSVKITGKRSDTKTVMLRLEGGGWKSASNGNSLATYPTCTPRLNREGRRIIVGESIGKYYVALETISDFPFAFTLLGVTRLG